MSEKTVKYLKISGISIYIILCVLVSFVFLPNILSFGRGNVEVVLRTGQTATIFSRDIDISDQEINMKVGDRVYLSSGVGGRVIVNNRRTDGSVPAIVTDIHGAQARVDVFYNEQEDRFKPGLFAFQVIVFLLIIIAPIVLLKKNDKLDVLFDFSSMDGFGSSKAGKIKYGDQGTAVKGKIKELKGLTGNDGYCLSQKVRLSAAKSYEHVMVLGPTGSGKSTSFFIPNLLDIDGNHSVVVTDPKGELYDLSYDYLTGLGYDVIKLSPLNLAESDYRYNPLEVVDEPSQLRDIAQLILTNGNKAVELSTGSSSGGAEWINMSIPLFAASLMYVKEFGKQRSIPEALDIILSKTLDEMEELFKRSESGYKQFLVFKSSSESEKTMSSIKTVLTTNVQLYLDQKIAKFVSPSLVYNEHGEKVCNTSNIFVPQKLRDRPTALFVCVPESKATVMMPLMSVFFTQLMDSTMEYKPKDGHPIYFMLDEFANIGLIPTISVIAATARSRNIGLSIGIQGVEQLSRNYGEEEGQNLMNNLKTKLVYSGLTGESAKYVSDLAGYTTIESKSYSTGGGSPSGKILDSVFASKQVSKSGTRRELLTADEVRRMPENEVLIIAHNRNPVFDRKNVYFTQKKYMDKCKEG